MVEHEEESNPFPPETTVWAKIGSHPWWPAKIEALEDLPKYALIEKPSYQCYPVYFFGTHEFGFPTLKNLIKYEDNMIYEKKCKQKSFIKGMEEIKNKSGWPEKGSFRDVVLFESEYEPDVVVGEDHDPYDMEVDKPEPKEKKPKKRKASLPSTTRVSAAGKKQKKDAQSERVVSERDVLMKLRMKLQMFLQNKDQYTEQDFMKADEYLKGAENIKMNIELFKETKIAKVIKHLGKKDFKEHDISERCNLLTQKWVKEVQVVVDVAPSGLSKDNSSESLVSADTISPTIISTVLMKIDSPSNSGKEKSPKKSEGANGHDAESLSPAKVAKVDGSKSPMKYTKVDTPKSHVEGSVKALSPKKESSVSPKSPAKESVKDAPKSPLKTLSPKKDAAVAPKSPATKEAVKVDCPKSPLKTFNPNKDLAKSPVKESLKVDAPKSPLKEAPRTPVIAPKSPLRSPSPKKETIVGTAPKSPMKSPVNVNK